MIPELTSQGMYWIFDDGRRLPVIAGGDGDDDPFGDALDDAPADAFGDDAPDPTDKPAPDPKDAKPAAKKAGKQAPAPKAVGGQPEPKDEPTPGPAPWEADLEARGLVDPAYLDYHREQVQPYITQREQELARFTKVYGEGDEGFETSMVAARVLAGLQSAPLETLRDLVQELELDPDSLVDLLYPDQVDDQTDAAKDTPPDPEAVAGDTPDEKVTPEIQFLRDKMEAEAQQEAVDNYQQLLTDIETELSEHDMQFYPDTFHIAMRVAEGDPREAWNVYTELVERHSPSPEDVADDDVEPPPPVIGGNRGRLAPQPAKVYSGRDGLNSAIDDFLAEDKASSGRK